jgi:RecJ-like exonuclease
MVETTTATNTPNGAENMTDLTIDALTHDLDLTLNNDQGSYTWLREMGREAIDRNADDIDCEACDGEGSDDDGNDCEECDGEGTTGKREVDVCASVTELEDTLEAHFDDLLDEADVPGILSSILSKAVWLIDYRTIARDVIEEIVSEDDELVSDEEDDDE